MTVAAVLDLFQRTRGAPIARRDVDAIASADVRAAFEACGAIVKARDAETMPCRERAGCAREVRDTVESGPRRLVAVCGQTPPECDPIFVTADALARVQLSVAGMTALLRRLFAIGGAAPALPEQTTEPIALGTQDRRAFGEGARDAFLALDPASEGFAPWLALRDRAARGAVVLVASSRGLAADLVGRYAVGDRVEIVLLEDALVMRAGALALTARAAGPPLRVVAGAGPSATNVASESTARDRTREEQLAAMTAPHGERRRRKALRKTKALDLPPITMWSELRICLVDGDTVRFDGAGKYARLTYHDLGMANLKNRGPTATWKLLALMCEGEGQFDWKAIAPSRETTRKHVSNLRKALQAIFRLADDPFVEHEGDYRPRFRARVGLPGEAGKA